MQIWPGCPLAFYRINVRPIRRTTIFNGSSHNGLLCAVKAQSLGEGRGDREQAFSRKCDPDKSGIASRRALSPHGFFDKMAHCCVSIFLFLLTSLSLTPSPSLFSSLFFSPPLPLFFGYLSPSRFNSFLARNIDSQPLLAKFGFIAFYLASRFVRALEIKFLFSFPSPPPLLFFLRFWRASQ